jgi:hypothetical protein
MSEKDLARMGADADSSKNVNAQLLNSKSVPALHQIGN